MLEQALGQNCASLRRGLAGGSELVETSPPQAGLRSEVGLEGGH